MKRIIKDDNGKDVEVDLKAEIGIIKSTGAFNHPKYNKTIYTVLLNTLL